MRRAGTRPNTAGLPITILSRWRKEIGVGVGIGVGVEGDALGRNSIGTNFKNVELTALAIFVDELQYVREEQLAALITALHRAAQGRLPVVLVGEDCRG